MQAVAIIPARGGSKGVPRKNVRPLCGKPLVAWTLEAAQQAAAIDRVVVSTDDPEIARISRSQGAQVIWRPPELAGDTASSEAAVLHALEQLEITGGAVAFLQCTAPLIVPEDIDGTLSLLAEADTAFTAAPWHGFPWFQEEPWADPIPVGHSRTQRPRRQDRRGLYLEVGAVYAMDAAGFRRARHRFFGRTRLYPIAPERSLEIDDESDWLMAEALLRRRLQQQKAARLPRPLAAVVLDFDGVLTDNRVFIDEGGREGVVGHRGDGWALGRLKAAGVAVLIVTKEVNPVVQQRCRKLGVPCLVAAGAKLPLVQSWLAQRGIDARTTVYVGNDEPDVPCMLFCGCGVAPADAAPTALRAAQIVLDARGGQGCVRELWELVETAGVVGDGAAPHRG